MKQNLSILLKFLVSVSFFTVFTTTSFSQYSVEVLSKGSALNLIRIHNDTMSISKYCPYKIFAYKFTDINNDGSEELILGVIKKTIYDTVLRKRINIWKLNDKRLVPLWLGSLMPHPLEDFNTKDNFVYTIEYEEDKSFLVAQYCWHSFGLKFMRYIKRNIDLNEAKILIK